MDATQRYSAIAEGPISQKSVAGTYDRKCFECGQPWHLRFSCPELVGGGWNRRRWWNGNVGKHMRDGVAKPWQRSGDWLCPMTSCGNVDFAFRGVRNRCGALRPSDVSGVCAGGATQTVIVQMTVDDMKKWYQFKGIEQVDKKICETAALSARHCSNGSDRKGAPWLIDSGASRHMAGSYGEFHGYVPEIGNQSVKLADGSAQAIMGSGKVKLNSDLSLSSVLHVPTFPINLMSISCITQELNCAAIFFPSWCIFLEVGTWKILGTRIMRDGLYYLDDDTAPVVATALSLVTIARISSSSSSAGTCVL